MPPIAADRDLLDWATLVIAIAALALSIRNVWATRERLQLYVEGAFLEPLPGQEEHGNCVVVVRNPSSVPIVIEDIGFRLGSGRRLPASMYAGPPFPPLVLEPGHRYSAYSNIVELATLADADYDNDPATHAWVRSSGHRYTEKKLPSGWLERWVDRNPPARE